MREDLDVVLDPDETPFSRRLHNLLGNEIENFNFLILDRVELLPKYRGDGVGNTGPPFINRAFWGRSWSCWHETVPIGA